VNARSRVCQPEALLQLTHVREVPILSRECFRFQWRLRMPNLFRSALAFVVVCATLAWAQPDKQAAAPEYRLGPGDSVKVQVYQNPDLSLEARVSETGTINYPLVGSVTIGGLSVSEAEQRIAEGLQRAQILKQPQVNIVLLQVRGSQVSVLGEVQRPGRFPLETATVRVSDMLAAAGGISAAGDDVLVVTGQRGGNAFRKSIDVPSLFKGNVADDILLQAGDTLYVAKAPTFYIYGEAQRPGTYKIDRGMTVLQALAQGGGPTARGSERIRLTRTRSDGSVLQLEPRMTDLVLPGDVLYIKESLF
jgi:polysaccharide biosynthesis/export protein